MSLAIYLIRKDLLWFFFSLWQTLPPRNKDSSHSNDSIPDTFQIFQLLSLSRLSWCTVAYKTSTHLQLFALQTKGILPKIQNIFMFKRMHSFDISIRNLSTLEWKAVLKSIWKFKNQFKNQLKILKIWKSTWKFENLKINLKI